MPVDAHAHVWGPELLGAHWLQADASAGIRRPFGTNDLEDELARNGVDRVVLVAAEETDAGNLRLLEVASHSTTVGAVVAWADPAQPNMAETIARLRSAPGGDLLRGVRVSAVGAAAEWWWSRDVVSGLGALRDLGLVVEALAGQHELPALAAVCRGLPGLTMVVDHLGGPTAGGSREAWRNAIRELADVENVLLKVSGSAVFAPDLAMLLAEVRDLFGAGRLMAGSDWPVSTLHGGGAWRRVVDAASAWSDVELAHLTGGTATRTFGIAA